MTYTEWLDSQGIKQSSEATFKQFQAQQPNALGKAVAKKKIQKSKTPLADKVLGAYKKDKVATREMMRSEDIDRSQKVVNKSNIEAPGGSKFTGDAEGIMSTGLMALGTAKAQDTSSAIIGGAMTGLSASTMIGGAAAGPAGIAIGVGSALMGMANARKAKKARQKAERERKEELRKARELSLLESQGAARQRAIESLMGAF